MTYNSLFLHWFIIATVDSDSGIDTENSRKRERERESVPGLIAKLCQCTIWADSQAKKYYINIGLLKLYWKL